MSFDGLRLAAGVDSPRCRIMLCRKTTDWSHRFRLHCRLNQTATTFRENFSQVNKSELPTRVPQMSDSDATSLLHSAAPRLGVQPTCLQPYFTSRGHEEVWEALP